MHFTKSSFFLFLEKILFNVVLILLGQYCTGKNLFNDVLFNDVLFNVLFNDVLMIYSWDNIAQGKS